MELEEIRDAVFGMRPLFGNVVRDCGDMTWVEYYAQEFPGLTSPSEDVLNAIHEETQIVLGEAVASKARASVAHHRWTNTADHHGLLFHPYFYSAALARSHERVRKDVGATVTLPFGGISLSNDSFPRGCAFHDKNGMLVRIFFKSLKERRLPVYALQPFPREVLMHEAGRIGSCALSPMPRKRLQELFEALLAEPRVWSQTTYSAQLTVMNSILWHTLFKGTRGEFIYLEIDSVVDRLLREKYLCNETLISKLLFDEAWRHAFVTLFSGVTGSHTDTTGTHLFWYIDRERIERRGLRLQGGALVTHEGDVTIPLAPEDIAQGLQTRTLMPSSALLLIALQWVEGLACAGGLNQLGYLSHMMGQWGALVAEMGGTVPNVPKAGILCGENTLFGITRGEHIGLATLIDVLLYHDDVGGIIDDALTSTPLRNTVDAMLPTLYSLCTRTKVTDVYPHMVPCISIS